MAGFDGQDLGDGALSDLVRERSVGNFILFTRNIADPTQVRRLNDGLRDLARVDGSHEPVIAVDQEGGMVSRVQKGGTWFPGALACAAALEGQDGSERPGLGDLGDLAMAMAAELCDMGFNLDLAPVADINSNPANPVIGVRSYGESADLVAMRAVMVAKGLARGGLLACGKHFPGHGDTAVDSHFGLPSVDGGLTTLEARELVPFRALAGMGIASLMTAHILLPGVVADLGGVAAEAALPATLNPLILQGLLRRRLGFQGLIISDCLTMQAIANHFPDAAVQALAAGVDLLCISHGPDRQAEACERIESAIRHGRLDESRLDEAVGRVRSLQAEAARRRSDRTPAEPGTRPANAALARRFSRSSLHARGDGGSIPLKRGETVLHVDTLPAVLHGADDSLAARTVGDALARLAPAAGLALWTVAVPAAPDPAAIETAVRAAADCDRVILGLYDARRHPGQLDLLAALRRCGKPLSLVAMRSPYDAGLALKDEAVLLAFEYTPLSVETVADFLTGTCAARGGCPVSL